MTLLSVEQRELRCPLGPAFGSRQYVTVRHRRSTSPLGTEKRYANHVRPCQNLDLSTSLESKAAGHPSTASSLTGSTAAAGTSPRRASVVVGCHDEDPRRRSGKHVSVFSTFFDFRHSRPTGRVPLDRESYARIWRPKPLASPLLISRLFHCATGTASRSRVADCGRGGWSGRSQQPDDMRDRCRCASRLEAMLCRYCCDLSMRSRYTIHIPQKATGKGIVAARDWRWVGSLGEFPALPCVCCGF